MTGAHPSRVRSLRRRVLRSAAVGLCALLLLSGSILAIYLARPESGPGHELLDAIEYPIRQSEDLQYNVHRALGKMFSLCPCTAGLSADQYRRASFHRPHQETPLP
jgi:hypothetical protein